MNENLSSTKQRSGEKQIRMNEVKIIVMVRFTITAIETEICESPTLTAETSLERLPTSSFKPNPSYFPINASTFGIIWYLTSPQTSYLHLSSHALLSEFYSCSAANGFN